MASGRKKYLNAWGQVKCKIFFVKMPAEFDMTCCVITMDDLIVRALGLLRLIGVNFGNKGKKIFIFKLHCYALFGGSFRNVHNCYSRKITKIVELP